MPLQKLQFRPGVNREGTTLSNEGGWYDCDKVRFRSGYPEKIGGWAVTSYNTFLGFCRSLWNWITFKGYNLVGVGTNLKFYIENGGLYYDITPIRETNTNPTNEITLDITTGSNVLTITDTNADSLQVNDFVTLAGATNLGSAGTNVTAAVLNQEYQIASVLSNTQYTVVLPVNSNRTASDSTMTGLTIAYQINTGYAFYTVGTGWGAGAWSRGTWGSGATTGFGLQLRLWSQANFGEYILFNPRGNSIYVWQPGAAATPGFTVRGVVLSSTSVTPLGWTSTVTDAYCPTLVNEILVSDRSRILIAFGCNDPTGTYGPTTLDPMLIRWSDVENYLVWEPDLATNQAGDARLSHGSYIVGVLQTRQEILVWTDTAIYSMQYIGPPDIWQITLLADNISIAGMNAMATAAGVVYWMGTDKFYVYSGRVETLPCSIRQYIFEDINRDQQAQFFAGTNEGYSEIWWFYCSKNAGQNVPGGYLLQQNNYALLQENGDLLLNDTNDVYVPIDRYAIFNYLDRVWYYGTMDRTAWLDSPLRDYPMATVGDNLLVYHEAAVNNGITNPPSPISAYIQSSDFDIGDGHNYGFVWRMLPDITFDNSDTAAPDKPQVRFVVRPRQNPGSGYGVAPDPTVTSTQSYAGQQVYNVQEFTEIIYSRVRGRQMAFKVESDSLGTQWQLGVPRLDVRPDGRR